MSGPDKPKVIGEEWDDERIRSFLFVSAWDQRLSVDYQVLLKAYEAMRAADFERFLDFFVEAGRDPNGRDARGRTLLDRISRHRRGVEYTASLRAHGGRRAEELDS